MSLFSITAHFDSTKLGEIYDLRPKHHAFIAQNRNSFVYGGLFENKEKSISGIMIIVKAININAATRLIQNDPYFPLFSHVAINNFEQKLPE